MEREKKNKRKSRDRKGEEPRIDSFSSSSSSTTTITTFEKASKRQDINHHHIVPNFSPTTNGLGEDQSGIEVTKNDFEMGVFDFPWLKDGSIYEQSWCYLEEDTFFSSFLKYSQCDINYYYGLCPCPMATCIDDIEFIKIDPVDKFEDTVWPLEMEGESF